VAFHHQLSAYFTDTLIGALDGLRRFLGGQKATLLWDGLPAHRSRMMRLASAPAALAGGGITAAYTPELNPCHRNERTSIGRPYGAAYSPQRVPAARKVMVALGVPPLREPDSSLAAPKPTRNRYTIPGSPKLTCRRRP
jgi:hypothetical protein